MNIQSYLFNNLFIITTSPAVLAVAVQAVGSIIYSGNPANLAIQQYRNIQSTIQRTVIFNKFIIIFILIDLKVMHVHHLHQYQP